MPIAWAAVPASTWPRCTRRSEPAPFARRLWPRRKLHRRGRGHVHAPREGLLLRHPVRVECVTGPKYWSRFFYARPTLAGGICGPPGSKSSARSHWAAHCITRRPLDSTRSVNMEIFDYDNILLLPRKCRVESRSECDTSVEFGGRHFKLPAVPANMKTVLDESISEYLAANGYFYVMHRFDLDNVAFAKRMRDKGLFVSISSGVKEAD